MRCDRYERVGRLSSSTKKIAVPVRAIIPAGHFRYAVPVLVGIDILLCICLRFSMLSFASETATTANNIAFN